MINTSSRRLVRSVAISVAALVFAPAMTFAQTIPATQPATTAPTTQASNNNNHRGVTTQPGGTLLLNFQDASIDTVLNELSAAAGFIVVKEVKPEGRVTLVSKQPMNANEAVSLLNTVVRNAGYAAIKQGRILKIVMADSAKRLNIPVRSGADPNQIEQTDELITQVIPLRYADAKQLREDLAPLVNGNADFTANASSNALVVTDTSANIRRIVEIVAALDTHLADATDVKVFQLKYANATTTARLINEVFASQELFSTGGQQQQGGGNRRGGGGNQAGGPGGGGGDVGGGPGGGFGGRMAAFFAQQAQQGSGRQGSKINASADDRTNTIVVAGPADTLLIVERVVKEMDSNPAPEEAVFIYKLKNGDALNIEAVTNMLFNGTGSNNRTAQTLGSNRTTASNMQSNSNRGGSGSNSRTGTGFGGNTGGFGGGNSPFGTGGTFGASNRTLGTGGTFGGGGGTGRNGGASISAAAAAAGNDLAGQVTIIADPDTNSLLVRTAPKNFDRVKEVLGELDRPIAQVLIKVLIAEVTHDHSYDLGSEFSVLNLWNTSTDPAKGQTAGTNFGLANQNSGLVVSIVENQVTARLRALETQGKLDVLSRPYILASDNQLASITVGQEIPTIQNSRVTDTGQTINTLEYQDIGILLDVIPHINPDGLVIMDVAPEISALTGATVPISDTASQPIIAKRSAQSRVSVRSGQTIVIGGLMQDQKTETVNKVPLLGDIPFVGYLFKRKQVTKTKTELLIFMTPQVASRPESLPAMSKDELGAYKIAPNAVSPGAFDEHLRNMQRGADPAMSPATQPTTAPVK